MTDLSIRGSKGDSKQHTPVESPDSLINISYANILDGISEGPIVGLVNGAQSIYLDKTPLANGDGSLNFTGVTWEQRTGEHDQDHISGFPAVESQSSVGVELKASQPWVQAFSNLELSAVRVQLSAGALVVTEKDGDRVGYRVAYEIDLSTDDSDYKVVHSGAFDGKTTTGYQRSIRIDLPKANRGWRLRVRRTTPDSTTSNTQATTSVGTYTEIIDAKLQYPYTALCGLKIDASQFSSIPERAYHIRGRIIQVPSNYTPATRAYVGTWDGTFKLAWTDCPAWIWRDIVLNDRYGLGRFIDSSQLDKWALYQIARYCDEMVSDGKGGREPRFTCNVYLQSRADALTVLQDLASVFRGMSYYASSQVACAADMPGDPVYTYTNANVIDGKFSRAGSSGSTRFSVAKVAWSDRENFGNQRVEYVQDQKSLARYGVRETEITAFGCVSQGQAQRAGQYILLTNRLETGTITFSVGLDGTICRPGDVIRVADQHYAGAPLAGRIKAATSSTVTLDDDVKVAAGDTLVVILPKGVAETRVVRSVAGRVVTVTQAFSAVPVKESVYTIETSTLVAETYRVLTVNENFGDDKLQYDVVAIARNNSKFAAIDDGAQIITPPTSVLPAAVQAPPTNVKLSTFDTLNQGINIATMRITWDAPRGAQSYRVWWKRNSGDWVYAGVTYTAAIEVRGIYSGTYTARVSAEGVAGNSSVWALSEPTALFGKMGEPPALASLKAESLLFGIGLTWAFPPGAEDTQRTELWYSAGTDLAKATKLADLAYPQDKHTLQGLRAGQRFYFWARLVDKSGNVGPWFPNGTTLVAGMASADAGPILEQIKNQITESELGKQLTSKIEKIELIDGNGPGSVNERVTTASNAIKADVNKQLIQVNSTIDGVRSNLQGQVTAVEGRMTMARDDLQRQIDGVSSIAGALPYNKAKTYALDQAVLGANGKLYQAKKAVPVNVAPPNTDYWEDVGQSVRTANGTASAVSKLQTDVTTLGDTVTATSGKVDGFQASINTANSNASAAQGAAQAANDLAGGKGKVIVQNAAPAAADRLPQNLWIDTTNGANTPKRWNGSAWVSVSDKVATDAAAAAQNALNQVGSKADASAVNSLKLTVEQQGRDLTSQGSTLNGLQTTIDGKASSQALTQLTSRVKLTEDKNGEQDTTLKSQSESLTTLKDTVSKKADVSSVSQLSNTVNLQGQDVTAHGLALTGITARLGELGASGVNLLPAEYSSFGAVAPNFSGTSFTYATVADLTAFRGYALKFDWSTTSTLLTAFAAPGSSNFAANMGAKRQKYIISYYARASVAGHVVALYLRGFQSDGSTYNTPGAAQQALTTEWARYSYVADMSAEAFTGSQMTLAIQQNRSGVGDRSIWLDRIMVEPVVNGATEPSTYVPGNSLDQVQATASAVTSLSGQVSKNAEGLKSTSELASKLDGSLTTTIGNVEKAQKAAQDAYGLADGKGKVIVQNAAPAAADRLPQNLWIDTTSGANTPKRWNGSAWVAVTDKVATEAAAAAASALGEVAKKADASAVNSLKLTVEQQGRDITAHSLDITSLNASVGNLGASGVNLVPAEYCAFTKDLPANMYSNGGVAMSTVADAAALKGYALKAANSNVDSHTFGLNSGFTAAGCNMGFKPGKYLVSFYARAEVAGHVVGVYARVLLADGSSFKTSGAPTFTLTTTWARYVGVIDLTDRAYTGTQMQLAVQSNRSGVANRVTYYDRFMLEAAVNNQVEPSTFSMGNSFDQSLANAAATVALDAKVTVNEGAITSASGQITELRNSIGDVGGENLIYNPSFEKPGANGLADGWAVASGSGATVSPSVVVSALNPKESAQRISVTGISPSVWARIGNPGNRRIGLKAGTSVTLSAYVRGTPGLNVRPEIQFLNNSGSGVSGPIARFTVASGDFVRISLSAVVPDGAVECNFFVTCYGTSSISTAFMDVDRMQFELSPTMTGWRDNGQAVTADQSATSTAVTNLTSTVGKQGGDLTTVTGQVTKLEGSVTNLQGDLPKKADVSALTSLKGTVEQNGRDIKAYGQDLTTITTTLGGIGASGVNLLPAEYSVFSKTPPTLAGSSYNADTVADSAALRGYALKFDWSTTSVALTAFFAKALNLGDANMGAKRQKYIISYYAKASVAGHVIALYLRGFQNDGSSYDSPGATQQALTTGWIRYSYVADMSANAFTGSQMILAIQLNRSGVANRSIWIDRIMVEPVVNNISEPSTYVVGNSFDQATATATALSLTETAVSKMGDKLTVTADSVSKLTGDLGKTSGAVQDEQRLRIEADSALSDRITTAQAKANDAASAVQSEMQARVNAVSAVAKRVDDTQTSLGNTNAMVNRTSEAVTGLNNVASASEVVRVQITANGIRHAAGFAVGIENKGGVVQSTFAILANRFAILSPSGDSLSSPFAVQGNQTFIADAYIRDASITNAKIADASINNAKIADASISAAKIGVAEVDTLRIRGNAVTVPISYSVQGQVRGAGRFQWMDIMNISVPMDEAGYVFIMFNCGQYYTSGERASGFTLTINGFQLMGNGGQPATPAPVVSGSIAVGPGVHNIKVTWYGDDASIFLDSRNIFVIGTKR